MPRLLTAQKNVKELTKQVRELTGKAKRDVCGSLETVKSLLDQPEKRQQLREALKQTIKQINILPVKLGTKRRDPVACCVQVIFHGDYVRQFNMCGNDWFVLPDYPADMETLDKLSKADLRKFEKMFLCRSKERWLTD